MNLQKEISSELDTLYQTKALEKDYRIEAKKLINTPGVFEPLQREELMAKYLPQVLPMDYPGSVIEISDSDSKNKNKNYQKILLFNVYLMKQLEKSNL